MLLAIQIYFTFKAFKNGWRSRVLIPWAIMAVTAFVVGMMTAGLPMEPVDAILASLPVDLGLIFALRHMANHAPANDVVATDNIAPAPRLIS